MLANSRDLEKVYFVEERVLGEISRKKCKIVEILDELDSGDNIIVSELTAR